MPNKFKWICIPAIKEKKKARAKRSIIMAVNKKMDTKACSEKVAKMKLRINGVYSQSIART